MSRRERILRTAGILGCQLFAVITFVQLLSGQQNERLLLAAGTVFLVLAPMVAERLLHCKISTPFYLFCLFYAIGPMLGHCHNLYYLVPWWDKMLHIFGGVVFAVLGLYVFERFVGARQKQMVFCVVFALCFSMAVSVIWEFAEFAADRFFSLDMQSDTVVNGILSYSLGEGHGNAGTIDNITDVVINGQKLPFAGYLDIGLIDTMLDMLLETLGALAACGFYIIDNGKHPVLIPMNCGRQRSKE